MDYIYIAARADEDEVDALAYVHGYLLLHSSAPMVSERMDCICRAARADEDEADA